MSRAQELFRADLIPPGSTVVCAVSGGADSVCLLHLLRLHQAKVPFTLVAAHYNHQLRGAESDRDEAFVRDLVSSGAMALEGLPPLPLYVGTGNVAAEAARRKGGTEEAARLLRYCFLQETAASLGGAWIATAHTADDNLETFFLHFLRGSGLTGLAGIRPVRNNLLRPMLDITRRDVEDHLDQYVLPHVEDSTNHSEDYSRNRIRHRVIPLLSDLSPRLDQRGRDTLRYLREDEDYLQQEAAKAAAEAIEGNGTLRIPAASLSRLPRPLAVRAVQQLLYRLTDGTVPASAYHLESILRIAASEDPGAAADLTGGVSVQRAYEDLILSRTMASAAPPPPQLLQLGENRWGSWRITLTEEISPMKAYRGPGDFFLLSGPYAVRTRREGDTLQLGPRPRKTVKKLLIDSKVPRARRDQLPVLERDGRAAALGSFGPERSFLAVSNTPSLHITIAELYQDKGE